MRLPPKAPPLTVCVLTYGAHCALARRCIESIRSHTSRALYRLVVGANAISQETDDYLRELERSGAVDRVQRSRRNLNKNPMMRRMFRDVHSPFTCWFDDDSHVTEAGALERLLDRAQRSPSTTVMWGSQVMCDHPSTFIDIDEVDRFVRSARWYRGLTPPSWEPGGKGEFDFEGRGTGNGRWDFILGGFWLMRTLAIRTIDWPDRRLRKLAEDVLLGEALRQQGWTIEHAEPCGVAINQAPRRGEIGGLRSVEGQPAGSIPSSPAQRLK